jgi:hypothetical protein
MEGGREGGRDGRGEMRSIVNDSGPPGFPPSLLPPLPLLPPRPLILGTRGQTSGSLLSSPLVSLSDLGKSIWRGIQEVDGSLPAPR